MSEARSSLWSATVGRSVFSSAPSSSIALAANNLARRSWNRIGTIWWAGFVTCEGKQKYDLMDDVSVGSMTFARWSDEEQKDTAESVTLNDFTNY